MFIKTPFCLFLFFILINLDAKKSFIDSGYLLRFLIWDWIQVFCLSYILYRPPIVSIWEVFTLARSEILGVICIICIYVSTQQNVSNGYEKSTCINKTKSLKLLNFILGCLIWNILESCSQSNIINWLLMNICINCKRIETN